MITKPGIKPKKKGAVISARQGGDLISVHTKSTGGYVGFMNNNKVAETDELSPLSLLTYIMTGAAIFYNTDDPFDYYYVESVDIDELSVEERKTYNNFRDFDYVLIPEEPQSIYMGFESYQRNVRLSK